MFASTGASVAIARPRCGSTTPPRAAGSTASRASCRATVWGRGKSRGHGRGFSPAGGDVTGTSIRRRFRALAEREHEPERPYRQPAESHTLPKPSSRPSLAARGLASVRNALATRNEQEYEQAASPRIRRAGPRVSTLRFDAPGLLVRCFLRPVLLVGTVADSLDDLSHVQVLLRDPLRDVIRDRPVHRQRRPAPLQ